MHVVPSAPNRGCLKVPALRNVSEAWPHRSLGAVSPPKAKVDTSGFQDVPDCVYGLGGCQPTTVVGVYRFPPLATI